MKSIYKHENRLWELERSTGMFIDEINGKKVLSLCFLCHNAIYKATKGYVSFEIERTKIVDENGKDKTVSKFIYICSDCIEH